MTKPVVLVLASCLVLASGCSLNIANTLAPRGPAEEPAVRSPKYQKAVDAVYPALVRIKLIKPAFRQGREVRVQAGGSGVIVSPDGHVVTNHHVAGKATNIVCVLPDKQEVRARRVGTDPLTDICVLQLLDDRTYPHAAWGDSSRVEVGDTVLAMGSPGALSQSVTAGVASNVDLILPRFYRRVRIDGENVGSLVKWIAHDAAIFSGNSGGPLVNLDGEVIGINELGLGLGAAIPSNLARQVVDQILRRGEPRRSWLGFVVQPLLKSDDRGRGALVGGVLPDSPAADAGLEPGDILLSYAGRPVAVRFPEDLPELNRRIAETPVGDEVRVVVERDGRPKTLTVCTRRREPARGETRELQNWGMAARDLTAMTARRMKRASTAGALVASIRPGGPCASAKPAVRPGDVIVEVNGEPVETTEKLVERTREIVAGSDEPVRTLVAFEREHQQWLTLVKVGIEELRDRSPEARKAWLPVSTQVVTTDLAKALGLPGVAGVRLTAVFEGRSAETGGLQVGDIVTAIDGDRVRASRPEDVEVFPAMVRQRRVGQEVELSIIRDGKKQAVQVTLERSPRATREMKRYRHLDLGFTARDLSEQDRRARKIEKGVVGPVLSEVQRGSLAAVGGLRDGDIVLKVGGRPTPTVSALKELMAAVDKAEPPRVVFFVRRGITTLFVEVETPWLRADEDE
ncbi:MAG: PDZ domain-containing protein [Planctomycetota bacterium]